MAKQMKKGNAPTPPKKSFGSNTAYAPESKRHGGLEPGRGKKKG